MVIRDVCMLSLFGDKPVCMAGKREIHLTSKHWKILICLGIGAAVQEAEITRERLYKEVWPNLPDPASTYAKHLSEIRTALNSCGETGEPIDTTGKTVRLLPSCVVVDAAELMSIHEEVKRLYNPAERKAKLEKAVANSEGKLAVGTVKDSALNKACTTIRNAQRDVRYELAICLELEGDLTNALKYAEQSYQLDNNDKRSAELVDALRVRIAKKNRPEQPLDRYLTSFVPRDDVTMEVRQWLQRERLVTLTGPGGSGKTRLAARVASAISTDFPGGAYLIELADISDSGGVLQAVSSALGMRGGVASTPVELASFIRGKTMLLVLDNCEHLIASCSELVSSLLVLCSNVKVLATSRFLLKTDFGKAIRIPPMSLPAAGTTITAESLQHSEAACLFLARVEAAPGQLSVTDAVAQDIAAICRRIDGLPLAIELVATWFPFLSITQVRERLDICLGLLDEGVEGKAERHQTMSAVIGSSYDLIDPQARALLRRLAVFMGGWTLDAAVEVCGGDKVDPGAVLKLLKRLADASLVEQRSQEGASRYHMLETIREYARKRLEESGEEQLEVLRRHAIHFLNLAEKLMPGFYGSDQQACLDQIDREHANFFAALDWCASLRGEAEIGIRLSAALARFWWLKGYPLEGRGYLEKFLSATSHLGSTAPRAKALNGLSSLALLLNDMKAMGEISKRALDMANEIGDNAILAVANRNMGSWCTLNNDRAAAGEYVRKSVEFSHLTGDPWHIQLSYLRQGEMAIWDKDFATACQFLEQCVQLCRSERNLQGLSASLYALSRAKLDMGEYEEAQRICEEVERIDATLGLPGSMAGAMLGLIALRRNQPESARRILEAHLAQKREHGRATSISYALQNAARACVIQEDHHAARLHLEEALQVSRNHGLERHFAIVLDGLGCLAASLHEGRRAAILWGASEGLGKPKYLSPPNYDELYKIRLEEAVRAIFTKEEFEVLKAEGRGMNSDQALDSALRLTNQHKG